MKTCFRFKDFGFRLLSKEFFFHNCSKPPEGEKYVLKLQLCLLLTESNDGNIGTVALFVYIFTKQRICILHSDGDNNEANNDSNHMFSGNLCLNVSEIWFNLLKMNTMREKTAV